MPDLPREDLIGINIRVSCSRPGCAPQHPCPACLEIIGDAGTPCQHCGTLLQPKYGADGQLAGLVDGAGQSHDCDGMRQVAAELLPPRPPVTTTRRFKPPADPEYRKWYEKGWRYSGTETATLDHLDHSGWPEAAYDGYLDMAAGRDKWHIPNCPTHDTACPEGG